MRVLIIQRIFSNYRKPVFDELSKNADLLLIHTKNRSGIKQTSTEYSRRVFSFRYGKKETQVFLSVLPAIMKFKPDIIVHEFTPSISSLHFTFMLCRLLNIKFVLWGHGYNQNKGFNPKKSISAKIRLFYLRQADAVILYGYRARSVLSAFVNESKLFVAPNTLDTVNLLKIKDKLEKEGKENLKKRIGFNFKYNLIFIGRLLKAKMPEILIDLYDKFPSEIQKNLAVHFIGGGEMLVKLKQKAATQNHRKNIFFHGSVYDENKNGEYLYASDLMVMPGFVGLSVNHAFCFQCPVATFKQGTSGPYHSPEIEYLIEGKTGILARSFDIEDMTKKIYNYLISEELQKEMRQEIDYTIHNVCALENMVQGFLKCFNSLFENEHV